MTLWNALRKSEFAFVKVRVSPHHALIRVKTPFVPDTSLVVFPDGSLANFAVLQSRAHEIWARFFSSTLEDRLRYAPSDCFETFPFPPDFRNDPDLEVVGQSYYDHRAALMVQRSEGITKAYNRFHELTETSADIMRLRELHAEMDRAVLRAYGWGDLANHAQPEFLTDETEDDHTYKGRLFWPSDVRDEILARLLKLNSERHEEEVRLGLAKPGAIRMGGDEMEDAFEDAAE